MHRLEDVPGGFFQLHGRRLAVKSVIPVFVVVLLVAAGCANNKKDSSGGIPKSDSVTDISTGPVVHTSQPPVTAVPEPTITQAPTTGAPFAVSSGTYVVKKGDTLYGIAKARYGNGKEYTRIVSANPGISPTALRVGQTLAIP
jgi:LysM repeat protein